MPPIERVVIEIRDDDGSVSVVAYWSRDPIMSGDFTPAEMHAAGLLGSLPDDVLAGVEHRYYDVADNAR